MFKNRNSTPCNTSAFNAGYTLIELVLVLAIVGIFLSSGLRALHIYNQHQAYKHDKLAMASITTALRGFLSSHGRYPCPSQLNLSRNDASYGIETDCTDTSQAIGDCSNGLCIEESVRTVPALGTTVRIRRGSVPFRALNIFEEDSYDGYGNKISYAVTEILADDATFNAIHGGVSVVDEAGNTAVSPPSTAHFVILSHGKDGKGAYTHAGVEVAPCTGTGLDVENCNTTADSDAVYLSTLKSYDETTHYDDTLTYRTASERPLWRVTNASNFDITDLADTGGGIGGGATPSAPVGDPNASKLDISGDIKARGDVRLSEICDENDDACFPTSTINSVGIECVTGFATGVSNSALDCAPAVDNNCPAGQFMVGIDADRKPICQTPPANCNSTSTTLCAGTTAETTYALPNALPNTFSSPNPLTAGISREEVWQCSGGSWQRNSTSGICTCTPATWTDTTGCPTGFSGSITVEYTRTCPDNTVTSTEIANSCTCQPDTQTQTQNCASGFTGTQTRTRDWVCDDPSSGHWTSWTPWTGTCTCQPDTQSRTLSCPAGYSGTGDYEEKYFQCPAGTWDTSWTLITPGNCTCTPVTETDTQDCPPGEAGEITRERTSLCPSGGWSAWTETDNTCTPITCSWNPATSTSTIGGTPIGKKVGTDCTCGTSNQSCWESLGLDTYKNYPSCACISDF